MLEQLPNAVLVVDRTGRPQMMNHAARSLDNASSMLLLDSLTSSEPTPLTRALSGETISAEEYTLAAETSEPRRLRVWGMPRRDAVGEIIGAVVTLEAAHASQLAAWEAATQSMAHGERLRALGEMASGIAHDLNQSLALITGYTDMVRQELALGLPEVARVREMIDITARAALRCGKALRGLLSFVHTQDLIVEIERVDVAELLEDVARLTAPRWRTAPQAEGRPITLELRAEANSWINGSPAELRDAITNLIFNAVDALPHGGAIRLFARGQGEQVLLELSDTGTGMPREVQARIFDPFYTTKGELGTGLGLPQVLAIVERHGGSIEVESAVDRGTTFRVKFPRASPPAAAPRATYDAAPAAPGRAIRILVVEDEVQLARMAGLVLTQRGHQVEIAESGADALARLAEDRFDLVISDLGLGAGKNGWDLAEHVRRCWPATRFVLVTGWGAAIDPAEARQRGVAKVIAKPYRISDLRQVADDVASAMDAE